jgi:hypothetical protein
MAWGRKFAWSMGGPAVEGCPDDDGLGVTPSVEVVRVDGRNAQERRVGTLEVTDALTRESREVHPPAVLVRAFATSSK